MGGSIDEKTRVQLFAVLSTAPVVIGFVMWLTTIYLKAEAAVVTNEKQDVKIEAQTALLIDIRDRLIRLESKKEK